MLHKTFLKIILTILITCNWFFIMSQEEWVRVYGNDIDNIAWQVIETYDGGYMIGGHTQSNDNYFIKDGLLIKTDINGNILWQKIIGGGADDRIDGNNISQTFDGGYILLSGTYNYGVRSNVFIMKLNKCGEKEWSKVFIDNEQDQYPYGVVQMPDSTYLMMLSYWKSDLTNDRVWIFNIGQDGKIIWQKTYANWTMGTNAEEGRHLIKNINNEYLITGDYYQYNPGEDTNARWVRPMFIKIDSLGNEMWHLLWGENDFYYGGAKYSCFDNKENIYSVGFHTFDTGEGDKPALFKIGSEGIPLYTKDLIEDADGGGATTISILEDSLLFIGATWRDPQGIIHNGVMKTDTLGNILNQKDLLNVTSSFYSSLKTYDNKYLVMGNFYIGGNWDIYLWKFNKDLEFDSIYTQPRVYDSLCPYPIVSDTIDLDTTTVNLQELYEQMHQIKVRPNPASSKLVVTLGDLATGNQIKIFNSNGQEVKQMNVLSARREYEMDVSGLPTGLYVVVLFDKGKVVDKQKVVISH